MLCVLLLVLQDGGHVLLRLTYVSAAEPGDILPPPRRDTLPSVDEDTSGSAYPSEPGGSSSSSSKGGAKEARGEGSRVAAGSSSSSSGEEGEGGGGGRGVLEGALGELLQKGYSDVKDQVGGGGREGTGLMCIAMGMGCNSRDGMVYDGIVQVLMLCSAASVTSSDLFVVVYTLPPAPT